MVRQCSVIPFTITVQSYMTLYTQSLAVNAKSTNNPKFSPYFAAECRLTIYFMLSSQDLDFTTFFGRCFLLHV
jgi:hypothetical protein